MYSAKEAANITGLSTATLTRIIHGSINSHKIRRSYHYNHS